MKVQVTFNDDDARVLSDIFDGLRPDGWTWSEMIRELVDDGLTYGQWPNLTPVKKGWEVAKENSDAARNHRNRD